MIPRSPPLRTRGRRPVFGKGLALPGELICDRGLERGRGNRPL